MNVIGQDYSIDYDPLILNHQQSNDLKSKDEMSIEKMLNNDQTVDGYGIAKDFYLISSEKPMTKLDSTKDEDVSSNATTESSNLQSNINPYRITTHQQNTITSFPSTTSFIKNNQNQTQTQTRTQELRKGTTIKVNSSLSSSQSSSIIICPVCNQKITQDSFEKHWRVELENFSDIDVTANNITTTYVSSTKSPTNKDSKSSRNSEEVIELMENGYFIFVYRFDSIFLPLFSPFFFKVGRKGKQQ
jgi:hypothetical protein